MRDRRLWFVIAGLAVVAIAAYALVRALSSGRPAISDEQAHANSNRAGRPVLASGGVDAEVARGVDCARPNGDVAQVGDTAITAQQLCSWLTKVGAVRSGRADPTQAKQVLDRMVDAKLVSQAMVKAGLHVSDDEITAMLAQLGIGSGSAGVAVDPELLRQQARERVELAKLAALRTPVKVEDSEVDRELAAGAPGIDRGQGVRVDGWIARTTPGADAATSAKAEQAANDFAAEVETAKPETVAARHGLVRLPVFLLAQSGLEPELESAALAVPTGHYSRAIKTRTGWVVIRTLERVAGAKLDDKALRVRVRRALETRRLDAASKQLLVELRSQTAVKILVEL